MCSMMEITAFRKYRDEETCNKSLPISKFKNLMEFFKVVIKLKNLNIKNRKEDKDMLLKKVETIFHNCMTFLLKNYSNFKILCL